MESRRLPQPSVALRVPRAGFTSVTHTIVAKQCRTVVKGLLSPRLSLSSCTNTVVTAKHCYEGFCRCPWFAQFLISACCSLVLASNSFLIQLSHRLVRLPHIQLKLIHCPYPLVPGLGLVVRYWFVFGVIPQV